MQTTLPTLNTLIRERHTTLLSQRYITADKKLELACHKRNTQKEKKLCAIRGVGAKSNVKTSLTHLLGEL